MNLVMVWNLVALEPDAKRWLTLRPILSRLGYHAVAVQDVRAVESLIDAFDIDIALIRPIGSLQEHARLAGLVRETGTRVFVTAELARPQVLSQYYALGDQARTVRLDAVALATDLVRHARERVDLLPPVPPFDADRGAANDGPVPWPSETTERAPTRPQGKADCIETSRLMSIRAPGAA